MTEPDPMTFEDLSAAYRAEKKSTLLSDVRGDLYPSMVKLQDTVRRAHEAEYSRDPDSIMCEGMSERRKKVAIYIQKVIDLRMEKIATMALRTSMGADNAHDKLTQEEREYYISVVEGSKKLRTLLIKDSKRYTIPDISAGTHPPENVIKDIVAPDPVKDHGPVEEENIETPLRRETEVQDNMMVIRILEDIPDRISGPDCDYELRKEDVVRMPAALAKALINHEKAAALNVTP